jgi:hypothetical protein
MRGVMRGSVVDYSRRKATLRLALLRASLLAFPSGHREGPLVVRSGVRPDVRYPDALEGDDRAVFDERVFFQAD